MNDECNNCPLVKKIAELEAEIARLKKNSSNSHKPPSSDIVKPPKPPAPDGKKRPIGGQPGHEKHNRAPVPPEKVDGCKFFNCNILILCFYNIRRLTGV